MEKLTWTQTQVFRLKEFGIDLNEIPEDFSTSSERNKVFQQIEKKAVKCKKGDLTGYLNNREKSRLDHLKENILSALYKQGFSRVYTPTIISKTALEKMTIDEKHPLFDQVYWLNEKQCLRPMLAPNLYSLMKDLGRLKHRPIRFFELGACFRKESDGAHHNSEFTMLNLVEMGIPKENRHERLKELATLVSSVSGLTDFRFETEDSEVYGTTLDVVADTDNIEIASGAVGPHPLDVAWCISDTWVGIGFSIERLLMTSMQDNTIGKWGKSLSYLNGMRLNL